jgi:hypothetical protein
MGNSMKITMGVVPSILKRKMCTGILPTFQLAPCSKSNLPEDWCSYWFYVKTDMSMIPGYTGLAYPFCSPVSPLTVVSTATFNRRVSSFKSGENGFFLASTILGGRDVIEEFVAAHIWPLSHGWNPSEIIHLEVDWASQKVPFPRFGLRLEDGQSLNDFILKVEEKVTEMVSEYTLNEYKALKYVVKHKRRVDSVFLELGVETTLRSRPPGIDKKAPTPAAAGSSAAPPKSQRKRALRKEKAKDGAGDASSPAICSSKTKSLKSSKRKRKSSGGTSEAEVQAASGLAELGRKKGQEGCEEDFC